MRWFIGEGEEQHHTKIKTTIPTEGNGGASAPKQTRRPSSPLRLDESGISLAQPGLEPAEQAASVSPNQFDLGGLLHRGGVEATDLATAAWSGYPWKERIYDADR